MMHTLLTLHIAAGSVALVAMLPPLFSHKGGRVHRRSGWVFVGGMTTVCATALLLSAIRFATDPTPLGRQFSMLLFYVAILTGAGMWAGMRVLRAKNRTARGPAIDIAWAALLAASGALTAIYGFVTGHPLLMAFSTIGLLNGSSQIVYWLRRPAVHMHWWLAHMGNMLAACIAATTAFAIAGGRRLGLPGDSLVTWLGPTVIGLPVIFFWVTYYGRRFSRATRRTGESFSMPVVPTLVLLLAALAGAPASAQVLTPGNEGDQFAVASIKPSGAGPQVPIPRILPGGQLQIVGVTLRDLIRMAYPAAGGQVLVESGPAWVTDDRFDVAAKTAAGVPPSMPMLKRVLEERFKLQARAITRDGTVFSLVLARRDGRLGPSLQPADCAAATDCSTLRIGAGPTFFGQAVTMARFAAFLSEFPMISAPVIDRTGLTGTYDFRMQARADNNPNPEAGAPMPVALEEQLGLKLERGTGPINVVVIDRVERPDAD